MKDIIDINLFGGAFRFLVSPGVFSHCVSLHIKGLGELNLEYASEKMLSRFDGFAPDDKDCFDYDNTRIDDVAVDAYEACIDHWVVPE